MEKEQTKDIQQNMEQPELNLLSPEERTMMTLLDKLNKARNDNHQIANSNRGLAQMIQKLNEKVTELQEELDTLKSNNHKDLSIINDV